MTEDKKTIGLTPKNRQTIEKMTASRYFKDQIDAAKFAMAIAINSGVTPEAQEGTETIWNVGSFDPEGELRNLIPALFPEAGPPYRAVERFVNAGLEIVERAIEKTGSVDLWRFIQEPSNNPVK
jgi:hypothetical protein